MHLLLLQLGSSLCTTWEYITQRVVLRPNIAFGLVLYLSLFMLYFPSSTHSSALTNILSISMGEHQTNNSATFSIQHSSDNTALHTENTALLVMCITSSQHEQFVDQKCFKPVKAPPHSCNMKKNSTGAWVLSLVQQSTSSHAVLVSRPHHCAILSILHSWWYFN